MNSPPSIPRRQGFTLVEMLVAMTVLAIIMATVLGITRVASDGLKRSSGNMASFRAARAAFDSMTRQLSQATLNNYYDYQVDASGQPTSYFRNSDLHFVSGKSLISQPLTHSLFFVSPVGYEAADATLDSLDGLLNACGFFLAYGKEFNRPGFVNAPEVYRFRLMQFLQPTQNLAIFDATGAANNWFRTPLDSSTPPVHAVADNIIALIINPQRSAADAAMASDPLTDNYEYDTRTSINPDVRNQLPPLIEIVMVAIDEASARRLGNTPAAPDLGLAGLFTDPAQLDGDLAKLEKQLLARNLTWRIFRSTVAIRGSKWTSS